MKEPSRVYFGEVRGRGVFLRAAPIDVGRGAAGAALPAHRHGHLHERHARGAGPLRVLPPRRWGSPPSSTWTEASFPGPFDFARQAALVAPDGLPEPNDPGFAEAAADGHQALTAVTGGRAFVLCTSDRNMQALHRASRHLPYRILLQGERPKAKLLDAFRAEPSVLFATASFWEGVDVPGEALSLVVIDRLPFAPPNDPVIAARLRALEAEGRDGFSELSVPAAALALRQGFGRLVRTRTDRGLVAVLDRRLVTKGYGRAFLAHAPPVPAAPLRGRGEAVVGRRRAGRPRSVGQPGCAGPCGSGVP